MTLEQIKQERHAFEDFMRSQNDGDRLEIDEDGYYADISIECAWRGWLGRASKEEERDNWHSVAYNPPPVGVWLLGQDKLGQVSVYRLVRYGITKKLRWHDGTRYLETDTIVYWQSLPMPRKEASW